MLPAETSGVRVLHKTLDILEKIKSTESGYKLADLARKVELPKATVYRILTTLEGRGYLDRASDGSYRMAKKLFDLQRTAPLEQTLHRVSQPVMERLVVSCKETVNLGILDAGEVVLDAAPAKERYVLVTPQREIKTLGTTFAVRTTDAGTGVIVTRGQVEVGAADEDTIKVSTGLRLDADSKKPSPAPRASSLLDWTRELMIAAESVRIHWGHAPVKEKVGEATAEMKLQRLLDYRTEHGSLFGINGETVFDVRPLAGPVHRP